MASILNIWARYWRKCNIYNARIPVRLGSDMPAVNTQYALEQIWSWLEDVPDPEIPVLSVVDLGIIRNIKWCDEVLQIAITPTYSGCPAMAVIALDLEATLLKKGVSKVSVETVLSPPWTTDWISADGRRKLKEYGIAPPVDGSSCAGSIGFSGAKAVSVACPLCESDDTEAISQFGSTPCKASWRCKTCLEPFEYFKVF